MTVSFARGVLGREENEVLEMIDDGRIACAWNIAADAESARRELRLLAASVHDAKHEAPSTVPDLNHAIALVLAREAKPFIKSSRLRRLWLCSSELVIDLIDAGELAQVKNTDYRAGRNGGALITKESVIAFLKRRIA